MLYHIELRGTGVNLLKSLNRSLVNPFEIKFKKAYLRAENLWIFEIPNRDNLDYCIARSRFVGDFRMKLLDLIKSNFKNNVDN
jgi:hypothetical protein